MKPKVLLTLVFVFLFLGVHSVFAKVVLPEYRGYVNDYAEILSPEFEAILNQNLADFESKTKNEIAVATVVSMDDLSVEEYALDLFQKWGIGKKGQDNGLLLLIAPGQRQVRIEVGYGLEPIITDGRAGNILDTEFIPEFKKGNYELGVQNTVNRLEAYLSDPTQIPPDSPEKPSSGNILGIILFLIFTGLPIYFIAYLGRSKEIFTGGIAGAVIGFLVAGLLAGVGFGLLGLLLDYLLSKNFKNLKSSGKPTNFWTTMGGFKGGGFRSGGGGGFGGFGGGRSGGGGSSRGW
ncbi:MAG: TPM domain-containing protein [Candidatus Shapirobacteria bacterium]|jgi:uncharacterized protein